MLLLRVNFGFQVLIHEMRERRVIVEHSGRFVDMRPEIFRDDVCIFVSHTGNTEVSWDSATMAAAYKVHGFVGRKLTVQGGRPYLKKSLCV